MIILGIDPGLNTTGFGVIEVDKLNFTYKNSGCIRTNGNIVTKIHTIFTGILEISKNHKPDIAVVERIFMRPDRPNPDASIKLGHARGAIISAITYNDIAIAEYSANQIKKTIVGKGHANKKQVLFMVKKLLKLQKNPQIDASDALASAICHAYHCL